MSEERRLAVLRAIVEDYVRTREPVGSKGLVERHSLGLPATIRNDMAVLEEGVSPGRTSAGRVLPTRATGCSSTGSRSNRCPRREAGDPESDGGPST